MGDVAERFWEKRSLGVVRIVCMVDRVVVVGKKVHERYHERMYKVQADQAQRHCLAVSR